MAALSTEIHALLAAQHGHVGRTQLRAHGYTSNQIKHLIRRGDLVTAGRGAYRTLSVAESEAGRCAALCLGRPGVVIAGPTAARLWGFRKVSSDRRLHVLMRPAAHSITPTLAIVARRTAELRPDDVVDRGDGIRVTSRARTCLDLSKSLTGDDLLSVIEQAVADGGLTDRDLLDVTMGQSGRLVDLDAYFAQLDRRLPGHAESDGEVRIGDALRHHGIENLVRQHPVHLPGYGPIRFDLAVVAERWAVEIDLYPTHRETVGRADDARRDDASIAAGWRVRRVGRDEYEGHVHRTIADLVADYHRHVASRAAEAG